LPRILVATPFLGRALKGNQVKKLAVTVFSKQKMSYSNLNPELYPQLWAN
jgi:hypothetical protein